MPSAHAVDPEIVTCKVDGRWNVLTCRWRSVDIGRRKSVIFTLLKPYRIVHFIKKKIHAVPHLFQK